MIGVSVACAVVFAVFVVVCYFAKRRMKEGKQYMDGNGGDRNDGAQSGDAGSPNRGGGGSPGSNGHGIIFSSSSVQNNSSGNKTLSGSDGGVIVGGVS